MVSNGLILYSYTENKIFKILHGQQKYLVLGLIIFQWKYLDSDFMRSNNIFNDIKYGYMITFYVIL